MEMNRLDEMEEMFQVDVGYLSPIPGLKGESSPGIISVESTSHPRGEDGRH